MFNEIETSETENKLEELNLSHRNGWMYSQKHIDFIII